MSGEQGSSSTWWGRDSSCPIQSRTKRMIVAISHTPKVPTMRQNKFTSCVMVLGVVKCHAVLSLLSGGDYQYLHRHWTWWSSPGSSRESICITTGLCSLPMASWEFPLSCHSPNQWSIQALLISGLIHLRHWDGEQPTASVKTTNHGLYDPTY